VHLNPVWNNNTVLSLSPELRLDGELDYFSSNVNVDDTVLASLLESYIEDEIDETFTNSRLSSELQGFEKLANDRIAESLTDGRIDIELPEANDEQILALYRLLQPDARFPITLDMIRTHRRELLASLLFGEPTSPNAILADAVLCESASSFLSSAVTTPIYSGSPAQCDRVIDPGSVSGQTFFGQTWTDASCTKPIDYQPTSVSTYCDAALDPERLGNAASFPDQLKKWTHSPGSRLDISALGLEGLTQPFLRRFNYKQVETPRGTCELEMRVYSLGASSESQKPLLAFHGGSWQHRASGFIGIETMATHFANNGFTVFAPFYRLIGETDGNIACNDASLADIQEDINDAMDWVQERESEFGLVGKPTVFGQSAGGHLALSLATTRSDEIRRAVLFYAPTDFTDFAQQIKTGAYTNPAGLKILEAVTGSNIDTLDLSSPLVVENSFPALIAASETTIPPMFILHGEMDSLLPYRQAVRLCNALSGSSDFNDGAASLIPTIDGFVSKTQCGSDGSQLHLIAEGEHALDLCLAPGLCLAGSEQSADELAQSMRSMLQWSQAETVALNNSGTGSSFTGSTYWQVLLLLLLMRLWRTRGFYHSELTMKEYPHR